MKKEDSVSVSDKTDSITIKKNAKGEIAYDVKVYFNSDTKQVRDEVIKRTSELATKIEREFGIK